MPVYFYWLRADCIPGETWKKVDRDAWLDALSKVGSLRQRRDDPEYLKAFETGPFSDGLISGILTKEDNAPSF